MAEMINYLRTILLWLRWGVMSPEKRYAYLWQRTRDEMYTSSIRKAGYLD